MLNIRLKEHGIEASEELVHTILTYAKSKTHVLSLAELQKLACSKG